MEYRKLSTTDIDVSVVALGCWAFAGDATWGPQDEDAALATVHAALDAGVNFFDTAEAYGAGSSELLLGKALAGRRGEAVIASKVSGDHLAPAELRQACERSLRQLNTDYLDLYQIHWANREIPLAETYGALEELRSEGKVRAFGVCNFGVGDLTDLFAVGACATNQLPYSLLWRAIEYEIRQKCIDHGIGILCYSPLMQGLLAGKFATADEVPEGRARTRHFSKDRAQAVHGEPGCEQETFGALEQIRRISGQIEVPMAQVTLAWLAQQPGVTSILAGARSPDQILDNVQAAKVTLPLAVVAELSAATEQVKWKLGPNPDMWRAESRFR
ncbi:MAG: aldo/keto reductase [Herpetosiphonaceae bacterium]|nr:aldo/keto reductase [Herpetosiphonaceae bacterium]